MKQATPFKDTRRKKNIWETLKKIHASDFSEDLPWSFFSFLYLWRGLCSLFWNSDICEKFLQQFVKQYKDGKAHGLTHVALRINIEKLNYYRKIYRKHANLGENNRIYRSG